MTNAKRIAALYRKAAQIVDAKTEIGACIAMSLVLRHVSTPYDEFVLAHEALDRWFGRPAKHKRSGPWRGMWGRNFMDRPCIPDGSDRLVFSKEGYRQMRECRVLMLLFMAQIAETGDL
jgi:hypothetical protein